MSGGSSQKSARGSQARGEATKTRILLAVLDLIASGGIDAVTYRAVASAADVAQGVMTYHFATRRDLLSAAYRLHHERIRETAIDLPVEAVSELDIDDKAELVFGFVKSMVVEERSRYLAEFEIILEIARDPELRRVVNPESDAMDAFAYELVSAAGSTSPQEDALLLSAAIEGLVLEWMARHGERVFERKVKSAVRRLVEVFFPDRRIADRE